MTTITQDAPGVLYAQHEKPWWRRTLLRTEAALVLAIIVVLASASLLIPNFAQPYTYTTLLFNTAPILLMVLPSALIVITGEIDLSVGSVLGISSASFGLLFQAGVPLVLAAVGSILVGGLVGCFNGFLITVVGLPSLAVTIGTLALFRGVAVGLLGTTAVTDFPPDVTAVFSGNIPGIPMPIVTIPFIVLAIVFGVLLHATTFGRGVYAIGLSSETAAFSGVAVNRTKFILFVMSGLVAGLAGVIFTLQYSNAIGSNGLGFELQVVTAIVLGGVSIFGGTGSLFGAIAGALLIGSLAKALQLAGVGSDAISVVTGVALILSVTIASASQYFAGRRRATASPVKNSGA